MEALFCMEALLANTVVLLLPVVRLCCGTNTPRDAWRGSVHSFAIKCFLQNQEDMGSPCRDPSSTMLTCYKAKLAWYRCS